MEGIMKASVMAACYPLEGYATDIKGKLLSMSGILSVISQHDLGSTLPGVSSLWWNIRRRLLQKLQIRSGIRAVLLYLYLSLFWWTRHLLI